MNKEHDELVLLHVRTKYPFPLSKEVEEKNKGIADGIVKNAQELASKAEVKRISTYNLEASDSRDEICRQAKLLGADYLVLGTKGVSALSRMMLGSTTDYCAHHAECPVIIVR